MAKTIYTTRKTNDVYNVMIKLWKRYLAKKINEISTNDENYAFKYNIDELYDAIDQHEESNLIFKMALDKDLIPSNNCELMFRHMLKKNKVYYVKSLLKKLSSTRIANNLIIYCTSVDIYKQSIARVKIKDLEKHLYAHETKALTLEIINYLMYDLNITIKLNVNIVNCNYDKEYILGAILNKYPITLDEFLDMINTRTIFWRCNRSIKCIVSHLMRVYLFQEHTNKYIEIYTSIVKQTTTNIFDIFYNAGFRKHHLTSDILKYSYYIGIHEIKPLYSKLKLTLNDVKDFIPRDVIFDNYESILFHLNHLDYDDLKYIIQNFYNDLMLMHILYAKYNIIAYKTQDYLKSPSVSNRSFSFILDTNNKTQQFKIWLFINNLLPRNSKKGYTKNILPTYSNPLIKAYKCLELDYGI